MSAFGTKKKGGDVAVQLTFPEVTAAVIAGARRPYGYSSRIEVEKADLPVADDLQQQYHAEKKRWADAKAMEWVHNNARTRWLMNHNTYGYTQPHAVLGQRIFANPSLGNISDIYAARDDLAARMMSEGLAGAGFNEWFDEMWKKAMDNPFGRWLGDNGWKLLASAGSAGGMPGGDQLVETAAARQRRVREEKEKLEREERERKRLEELEDEMSNAAGPIQPPRSAAQRRADAAAYNERIRKAKEAYEAKRDKKRGAGDDCEMRGGVLRTAEGQKYGRQLLKDRIAQLDAIEAGRPGISETPFGPVAFPREPKLEEAPLTRTDERMLQLRALLETINGSYEENRQLSNLSIHTLSILSKTVSEAIQLLVQLSVDFSSGDFNDVLNLLLQTEFIARSDFFARVEDDPRGIKRYLARLYSAIYAMVRYSEGMFGVINSPRNEKVAKSRNLVKTIGLTGKMPDYSDRMSEFPEGEKGEINVEERIAQNPDNFLGQGRRKRAVVRRPKIKGGLEPCTFPEWEQRPVSNYYKPGDKVMYKDKAYECTSNTTNPPLRMPPDPNAGKVQAQWKEIPCGNTAKEVVFDPEALNPIVVPPQAGWDFDRGAQPFNPPPPAVPHQPYLIPEEPEGRVEKVKRRTPISVTNLKEFPAIVKFDVDQRIKFGDSQGAYYGEAIGDRVPTVPVPIPIEPDGSLIHPGSGYTRPTFPKFAVQKKPSNELKPRQKAPLPVFQDSASGIFSAPRLPNAPVTSIPDKPAFGYVGGLNRKNLPKTVEGFQDLAKKLAHEGHKIAIRPTSKLASIRATFIRKLKL